VSGQKVREGGKGREERSENEAIRERIQGIEMVPIGGSTGKFFILHFGWLSSSRRRESYQGANEKNFHQFENLQPCSSPLFQTSFLV